jgi:putative membrane protein
MILDKIWHKHNLIIVLLILFYAVGTGLFMIEETRHLFKFLTPFSLILSFGAVLVMHKKWSGRLALAFMIVFLASLFIEIIGVRTGVLFGEYVYGSALGIKIMDTPVMIGLNWLLLVYCTSALVNYYPLNKISRIFLGAGLMVIYDLVLEYVAPVMDMWSWQIRYPGIRNFGVWFLTAMVFHALFRLLDLKIENKAARFLFLIQILFFCGIALHTLLTTE